MTGEDWQALDAMLDRKLSPLHEAIKDSGSRVQKLDGRVQRLEDGSPHKCAEEIQKHEESSWSHNPRKAIGLGAGVVAIIEGVRAFFHK